MQFKKDPISLVLCFVIGGAMGVVAELIYMLITALGMPSGDSVLPVMLAVDAMLGLIFTYFGLYKYLNFSGFAAVLPFCGITNYMTDTIANSMDEGKSFFKAWWSGAKVPTLVFSFSIPFAVIMSFLLPSPELVHSGELEALSFIYFVKVFIAAGVACLVFHFIMVITKGNINLGWILVFGACLGVALKAITINAVPVMDVLIEWGHCGVQVMIPVAGSAFFNAVSLAKNYGIWSPAIGILCLLCWLYIGPAIFGVLLHLKRKKIKNPVE